MRKLPNRIPETAELRVVVLRDLIADKEVIPVQQKRTLQYLITNKQKNTSEQIKKYTREAKQAIPRKTKETRRTKKSKRRMVLAQEGRRRPRLLILCASIGKSAMQSIDRDVRVLFLRREQALDSKDQGTSRTDEEDLHVLRDVNST